jgi:hypothetical protein
VSLKKCCEKNLGLLTVRDYSIVDGGDQGVLCVAGAIYVFATDE